MRNDPTRLAPDTRERYRHFTAITTRLMDNDLYNHLNNATYYSFVDTAVSSYITKAMNRDLKKIPWFISWSRTGALISARSLFPTRSNAACA